MKIKFWCGPSELGRGKITLCIIGERLIVHCCVIAYWLTIPVQCSVQFPYANNARATERFDNPLWIKRPKRTKGWHKQAWIMGLRLDFNFDIITLIWIITSIILSPWICTFVMVFTLILFYNHRHMRIKFVISYNFYALQCRNISYFIATCSRKWRIKISETKRIHVIYSIMEITSL